MNDKSFEDIFREKLRQQEFDNLSDNSSDSPSNDNTQSSKESVSYTTSYSTVLNDWLFKINLALQENFQEQKSKKPFNPKDNLKSYQFFSAPSKKSQKTEQKQQTSSSQDTILSKKENFKSSAKKPAQKPQWSFEQKLIIQKFVGYGANLDLDSSFEEIKKSYRKLVKKYHPDSHQNITLTASKSFAKALQDIVEGFQSFKQLQKEAN